jgi:predicted PolB exonuclease-like 3'-5' exonuclease
MDWLCVFDCESVIDVELAKKFYDFKEESEYEFCQKVLSQHEKEKGTSFLPLPYHKIVVISAVLADENAKVKKITSIVSKSEEEILKKFLNFIDEKNPKLISFNGRGYDIPLVFLRAMKYNLSCPAFFEQENYQLNITKWENYRSRYSEKFHLDLYEVFGNFGAVKSISLDVVSQMVGFPGKSDLSGKDVLEFFYNGKIEEIAHYCESDALNTYLLFLKYRLLKGEINKGEFLRLLKALLENLASQQEKKRYVSLFLDYLKREVKSD